MRYAMSRRKQNLNIVIQYNQLTMMLQSMNTYITCKTIFTLNLRLLLISFILFITSFQCGTPQLKALDQHDAPKKNHLPCQNNQTDKKLSEVNLDPCSLSGEVMNFRTHDGRYISRP